MSPATDLPFPVFFWPLLARDVDLDKANADTTRAAIGTKTNSKNMALRIPKTRAAVARPLDSEPVLGPWLVIVGCFASGEMGAEGDAFVSSADFRLCIGLPQDPQKLASWPTPVPQLLQYIEPPRRYGPGISQLTGAILAWCFSPFNNNLVVKGENYDLSMGWRQEE